MITKEDDCSRTEYRYNSRNKQTKVSYRESWEYTYDSENRLQTVTGPDGVCLASYQYDLAGNLVKETNAQGRTTYRNYTLHGQVAEVLKPVKEVVSGTSSRSNSATSNQRRKPRKKSGRK